MSRAAHRLETLTVLWLVSRPALPDAGPGAPYRTLNTYFL